MDTHPSSSFEIFTDSMHKSPLDSPNNPFAFDNIPSEGRPSRGISPQKRKRDESSMLGPHEMWYNFRGKKFVRKVPAGPNGESWRETMRPVRLFQKEIEEEEGRRRKRRRVMEEEVEEVDTEEEGQSSDDIDDGESIPC
jgi:hypothetical protein